MMPPASTKTSVYKWNQEITGISKHIGETLEMKGLGKEWWAGEEGKDGGRERQKFILLNRFNE